MNTSESIKEIAAALSKAQGHMEGAKKDAMNPHFKSKYADLASVWEACRASLTINGLSVVQMTRPTDKDEVVVITRLMHASGEWIEGEIAVPVSKNDAQGVGSAITYARRYALAAAVGVAPEDDDGNAASKAAPTAAPQAKLADRVVADLKASMNEAANTEDLRKRTQKALAMAHQCGDTEAHASLKAYAVAIAEGMTQAA